MTCKTYYITKQRVSKHEQAAHITRYKNVKVLFIFTGRLYTYGITHFNGEMKQSTWLGVWDKVPLLFMNRATKDYHFETENQKVKDKEVSIFASPTDTWYGKIRLQSKRKHLFLSPNTSLTQYRITKIIIAMLKYQLLFTW